MRLSDWYRKHLLSILKRYEKGQATPSEQRFIDSYLDSLDQTNNVAELPEEAEAALHQRMKTQLLQRMREEEPVRRRVVNMQPVWRWSAAAAVLLLLLGSGIYWSNRKSSRPAVLAQQDKAPGANGAVLQLSDGSTLVLDSAANGTVATQGKVKVVKVNGAIQYEGHPDEIIYNTVTTGKGRQWKMILPDGTEAWLNAASSIRYPLSFDGKERVVDITGEVAFKVVHNAAQPFKVRVEGHVVEDLGTIFNINAYEDEPVVKTTLVEGLAKMNGVLLHPGQQAQVVKGQAEVRLSQQENAAGIMAWTNGQLLLESGDVAELLRKIARWYDVTIKIEGPLPTVNFTGVIDKNVYLSSVMKALAVYGIDARLEQQTLIVSAK
ncbi:FecR family protein [Chitinophaga qingshengii]|uniref:FecR domain-containing protein n=1 Tax=Chitinophaga qingshengii TaxID=1569794 RepID=A0ABR7TRB7_9BACT|nr:FecR family protein [Chitinophaga qingshengii]MBC9933023.1 FecR domain-containing protein [Chitinophaga qingshengii]